METGLRRASGGNRACDVLPWRDLHSSLCSNVTFSQINGGGVGEGRLAGSWRISFILTISFFICPAARHRVSWVSGTKSPTLFVLYSTRTGSERVSMGCGFPTLHGKRSLFLFWNCRDSKSLAMSYKSRTKFLRSWLLGQDSRLLMCFKDGDGVINCLKMRFHLIRTTSDQKPLSLLHGTDVTQRNTKTFLRSLGLTRSLYKYTPGLCLLFIIQRCWLFSFSLQFGRVCSSDPRRLYSWSGGDFKH